MNIFQFWQDWELLPLESQDQLARMEFGGGGVTSKTTGDINTAKDDPCTAPAASSGCNTAISASNSCGTGLSTNLTN